MRTMPTRWGQALMATGLIALAPVVTHAATRNITADITVSEAWTADNVYVLTQPIYVTNGATLTIEPGTVIRGESESSSGANDPGTLIITRGAKIFANGTPDKPIVFTDLVDSNVGGTLGLAPYNSKTAIAGLTEQWGGVVLLGRAFVANATTGGPDPTKQIQIEGLNAAGQLGFYGNCAGIGGTNCDDDDSGSMSYVSIRFGGFNLSLNNEINGLTLGGVGRETDIHHIEVFQNKDDGFEMFGGTVNLKNIISAFGGDDGIDYDEGWRGKAQFVFVAQGTTVENSDKGAEQDGGNGGDTSQPRAIPTIYNATFIGLGGNKAFTGDDINTALHFRDNAGGRYYNSFFADFGGATMIVEGGGTDCAAVGSSGARATAPYTVDGDIYLDPDSDFELEFQDNTFYCFGNGDDIPTGQCSVSGADCCTTAACGGGGGTCVDRGDDFGGDASKIHRDIGAFTNLTLDNDYIACGVLPIAQLDRTALGAGVPDPISVIDPRPAPGSPLLTTDNAPPADGFFEAAPYRGAFSPTFNWARRWSTLDRLGYFPPAVERVMVAANLTTSQTWSANREYVLTQPIYVTDGATLTIEPGTVIRGESESSSGANDPGTLIITRGAKIVANGTPDRPIIFTDLVDSNIGSLQGPTAPYDNLTNVAGLTEQWGGVVLLGRAFVANATTSGPDATRQIQIEGLNAAGQLGFYGNCAGIGGTNCDDDDSGSMSYVSVRFGGFNLSLNNEINGLTLGGVGRETDIHHIEVFQNKDDGFEMFGGTVNLRNLASIRGGDDGIDYDEGWRGKAQFVFVLQGTTVENSDKGAEQDGGNGGDTSQPRAIPTIANATYIGLSGNKAFTGDDINTALHFRDNAGGRYYNSFIADFGGAALIVEGGATDCAAAGSSGARALASYTPDNDIYLPPDSEFELELRNNTFYCIGNADDVPTGQCSVSGADCCTTANCGGAGGTCVDRGDDFGGDASKIHRDIGTFSNAAFVNQYLPCGTAPIRDLLRANGGGGNPDPVVRIDPRAAPGGALDNAAVHDVGADGVIQPTAFRGAFGPTENWLSGWASTDRFGMIAACGSGAPATPNTVPTLSMGYPVFLADEVDSLDPAMIDSDRLYWSAPQGAGTVDYDVLRSTSGSDFTNVSAVCIESNDGTDRQAVDAFVPTTGNVTFYLVRAGNACGDGSLGTRTDGLERAGRTCP